MSLARIVARSPQASNLVARKLRARGFQIEAHATSVDSGTSPDIEFSIEECTIESALEQAGRTGKWVFIAPGALADDVNAVIDFTAEEANEAAPGPVAEPLIPPSIVAEAPVIEPVVEMPNEPVSVSAEETELVKIEPEPPEAVVITPVAATIGDLVAPVETSDPVVVSDPPAESNKQTETPSLVEMPTVVAVAMPRNLEEPVAAFEVEVPAEVIVQKVEVEAEPAEQLVSDAAEQPAIVVEASAEAHASADLAVPPVLEMPPAPAPPEPLLLENAAEVVEEKAAIPALAAQPTPRKIRIVLPGFKKNAYLWTSAALVFTIGVLGMILISTKLGSHPASIAQPQTSAAPSQTPLQTTNAPAIASKASAPAASQPAVPRRHSASSDEGYIAKDTVVRYGSSAATSPKKSAAKARSSQN